MKKLFWLVMIVLIIGLSITAYATGELDPIFYGDKKEEITVSVEEEYTRELIGETINLYQEPEEVVVEDEEVYIPTIYDYADPSLVEELHEANELDLFYENIDDTNSPFYAIIVKDFNAYITRSTFYKLLGTVCSKISRNYLPVPYLDEGMSEEDIIEFNDTDDYGINLLYTIGIIPGTTTGNIYPYSNIDREEVSILLYNAFNYMRQIPGDLITLEENTISDYNDITDKYKRSMEFCNQLGLIYIDDNGYIIPRKDITYEEAIIACLRLYKYVIEYNDKVDPLYNNETNCYRLIKHYTGFNNAVLAGIMANIASESGHTFDPDIHQWGGGPGYGICQWTTESRKQGLYDYAEVCGYGYDTLECQCQYLMYELETLTPKLLRYLKEVSDTSDGAYNAGYQFCLIFEAPQELEACCLSRANNAVKYYNTYSEW